MINLLVYLILVSLLVLVYPFEIYIDSNSKKSSLPDGSKENPL